MPKVRDVIRRLEREGWILDRMRGSHRVYIHPIRPGHVTVAGHPPDDIPEGTWHNIQRQAGWNPQRESS